MSDVSSFLEELVEMLSNIENVLFLGSSIASLGISGAMLLITIIGAIVSFLISVALYIFRSIPVYKLAKKAGRKKAWLAWIPIFHSYFRTYVLADTAGEKPVSFFNGKITIKSRGMSFLAYLGILIFGNGLITATIGILNIIPLIGQIIGTFAALLYLVPSVATAFLEYAYLKDTLDLFKENKKSNNTAAIVIVVLDNLATLGFAQTIYLYTLLSRKLLPKEEPAVVEAPAETAAI